MQVHLSDPDRRSRQYMAGLAVIVLAAVAVRIGFWLWTHWTVEDAFIYGRMVRNFVERGQLSYNPGEAVSSATSPLFALLTALIAKTGIDPIAAAKLLGLVASVATCALIYDLLCRLRPPVVAAAGAMMYVLLPPVVAYSVGGMETALYAFACCLALERLASSRHTQAVFWASVALLLRPDGAVALVVVAGAVAWRLRRDRPALLRALIPVIILVPTGLLAHWLAYGTPVPHSVIAKGIGYTVDPVRNAVRYVDRLLFAQKGSVLIYLLAAYGVWRSVRLMLALWFFLGWYLLYYLFFIVRAPLFDWYLQPPLFVLCLFAALGLFAVTEAILSRVAGRPVLRVAQLGAGAALALVLVLALRAYGQGRIEAQRYEETVRAAAGRWLAGHAPADALVFTESLGYIGYQTRNPFVDWPGLASRDVPALLASTGTRSNRRAAYDVVIGNYQPRYLVLRDAEWQVLAAPLREEYAVRAQFPSRSEANPGYLIAEHR